MVDPKIADQDLAAAVEQAILKRARIVGPRDDRGEDAGLAFGEQLVLQRIHLQSDAFVKFVFRGRFGRKPRNDARQDEM